jgi:hypothetical protein
MNINVSTHSNHFTVLTPSRQILQAAKAKQRQSIESNIIATPH